ncbi:MAG: putative Ig domain-containing protein [Planctomycetota bacterium]
MKIAGGLRVLLLAAILVMAGWQWQARAASSSGSDVNSDDDTTITSGVTGQPGGTSPNTPKEVYLRAGNFTGQPEKRALIHFDLTQFAGLSAGSSISNATLKLTYYNNAGNSGTPANTLRIYQVTTAWEGGDSANPATNVGASWDQAKDGATLWTTQGGDFTGALGTGVLMTTSVAPATNAEIDFNVTSIVNNWINNGQANDGFIVIVDSEGAGNNDYYSLNEGPDYGTAPAGGATVEPRLNVTYTSVTNTTITCTQDTFINSGINNEGASSQAHLLSSTTSPDNMLLKFPITAQYTGNAQLATLTVYSAGPGGDQPSGGQAGTGSVSLYKLLQPNWDEGTGLATGQTTDGATWNYYDAAHDAWTTAGGDYDASRVFTSASAAWTTGNDNNFTIDVSALVVEAQAGSTTADFELIPDSAGTIDWRVGTKEYAGTTPPAPRAATLTVVSSSDPLPVIVVPTPAATTVNASQTITWTYAGTSMSTFDVYLGDGTTFKKISTTPVAGSAGNGTFTWTVDASGLTTPPASTYVVKIVEHTHQFTKTSGTFSIGAALTPISVTTTSLPAGQDTVVYNGGTPVTLAATGGTGTGYTWALTSGTMPAGLTLTPSTGAISGTPTSGDSATSPYSLQFTVTDSGSNTAIKTLTLTITPAPGALALTFSSIPSPIVNQSYSFHCTAINGTAPYTWSATGLPTGLSINPSTGFITGTPTALGGNSVTVSVTDSATPTPASVTSPTLTVTVVSASSSTSTKSGGCEIGGSSNGLPWLALFVLAGGLVVVTRRLRPNLAN